MSKCAVHTILKADSALQRLLHLLSAPDLISLASTCQALKQAVLLNVIPALIDVTGGLERQRVACKPSLRLAVKAIRLSADSTNRPSTALSIQYVKPVKISCCSKTPITFQLVSDECSRGVLGINFEYVHDNVLPSTFANQIDANGCSCPPHK